ncbi:FtsX-like permease family protein [Rurimicrobium arvi]|uniref:FtsX-like permease family protein n=1 Tax=Rurimicrobium arvi TaxID=2049916 RepID=A0ABP8MK40_9BACT
MAGVSLVMRIALRYLRGKGSANAVPVLSRISMAAIAVSSAAMIILFSVFNGFESLINSLYSTFYPDIRISAAKGKFFDPRQQAEQALKSNSRVAYISAVIEDNVLVNTESGETIPVVLKGVDRAFFQVNNLKPSIVKGVDTLMESSLLATAIVGQYVAASLGVDVDNVFSRISVYYPNPDAPVASLSPSEAFQSAILKPDGSFSVQEELDSKYIIAPLNTVRKLFLQDGKVSSLELKLQAGADLDAVKKEIQDKLGPAYVVSTRYEQNKAVYMVLKSEKWAGYAILLFVLLIASFNMISALSLLVLEKQKDMGILRAMGFVPAYLGRIVMAEGVLWALVGASVGLLTGLLLCWAQTRWGLVKIQGAFIIESYPVEIRLPDILVVLLTVCSVGALAAVFPARRARRLELNGIFGGK